MLPRLFCLVSGSDDLALLPALAAAGVDGFQVREKEYGGRELLDLTLAVMTAVPQACVVVNDRLDVALAAGADGVHLGAGDLPVERARRLAPRLLVGATCRSREEVEDAARAGASYAGFGPMFATSSKAGLPQPLGVDALAAAAGILPLVGIGGVDASRTAAVMGAGAHGVAVIGGIWRTPDPISAARALAGAVR